MDYQYTPPDGWDLKWFGSGEQQVVHERLTELTRKRVKWNPGLRNLYRPFRLVNQTDVRVIFVGQDPYPDSKFACGLAFSIPQDIPIVGHTHQKVECPPTLSNIFDEYESDLHYTRPTTGDLSAWCKQGVLLINAYPTCEEGRSMSHEWDEWTYLIKEVLAMENTVCVFFGSIAASFAGHCGNGCRSIVVSHPSPRASRSSKHPFLGSRIFSRVNGELCQIGKQPVDWKLI